MASSGSTAAPGAQYDHGPFSVGLVLGSIGSIQLGAAISTHLFDDVGPAGAVFIRALVSATVLAIIWRPRLPLPREAIKPTIAFGVVLAGLNLCFYESIDRLPLGVAVTLEFLGPLGVAVLTSRRRMDLGWAALALAGVVLLTGGLSGIGDEGLDPLGVLLALSAGFFWGSYILLGRRVGSHFQGGDGLAVAMAISVPLVMPFGLVSGGSELLSPEVIAMGIGVGVLSSAIPFSLEMEALRRIRPNVFGVLMSLEPGAAALVGFIVLGQDLSVNEVIAIILVAGASAGALWSARDTVATEP